MSFILCYLDLCCDYRSTLLGLRRGRVTRATRSPLILSDTLVGLMIMSILVVEYYVIAVADFITFQEDRSLRILISNIVISIDIG